MTRADFSRVSALVVDDNRHMVAIVRSLLHALGIKQVLEAVDAAQAFEIFKESRVDFIVVDFHMRPLDGLDFVRLVRRAEDSPNPFLPIILLTAYTEKSRVMAARDAGITEILAKPVTARDLYAHILHIVERPRAFVRSRGFVGPDRRRRADMFEGADKRRGLRQQVREDPAELSFERLAT